MMEICQRQAFSRAFYVMGEKKKTGVFLFFFFYCSIVVPIAQEIVSIILMVSVEKEL